MCGHSAGREGFWLLEGAFNCLRTQRNFVDRKYSRSARLIHIHITKGCPSSSWDAYRAAIENLLQTFAQLFLVTLAVTGICFFMFFRIGDCFDVRSIHKHALRRKISSMGLSPEPIGSQPGRPLSSQYK